MATDRHEYWAARWKKQKETSTVPDGFGDETVVQDGEETYTPEEYVSFIRERLLEEDGNDKDDAWADVDEDNINEVVEFANDVLERDAEVYEMEKYQKLSDQTGCFLTKRAAQRHIKLNDYHYQDPIHMQ